MNMDTFIPFIAVNENDSDNQLVSRNLYSILSSAATHMQNVQAPTNHFSLENFKIDKIVDPSLLNIKEFADNFKQIKVKMAEIEKVITDLEKKKQYIMAKHGEVCKILKDDFNINDTSEIFTFLHTRACDMINVLDLDRYMEEKATLLQHYKVAVPLLNQVKEEFFKDTTKLANCPICFEKEVSHASYPCGHLTCEECKKKIVATCFQCRGHVMKLMRIYPN